MENRPMTTRRSGMNNSQDKKISPKKTAALKAKAKKEKKKEEVGTIFHAIYISDSINYLLMI